MVDTVEGRLAALEARMAVVEARMAVVEGCSREVMRTVGIRFEEPPMPIADEGAVAVVLADGVDDAEGVEAPGLVVVDEAGPVDWEGLVGSEPAAETLSGGEG